MFYTCLVWLFLILDISPLWGSVKLKKGSPNILRTILLLHIRLTKEVFKNKIPCTSHHGLKLLLWHSAYCTAQGISLMLCLWFSLFNGMESQSLYNHIWFSSAIVVIFLFCLCDCHFTFCQRRLDHRHSLGGAGFARHRPSLVSASVGFGRDRDSGQPTLSARTEAIKQPQQTIPRKWWQNSWKMWVCQERF